MLVSFSFVFHGRAYAFVSPTWQGPAKVSCQNRVRNFVRQDAIENSFRCSDDFHLKVADRSWVVGGHALRGQLRSRDDSNRAGRRPIGQRIAEPLDRQIVTVFFGGFGDSNGELVIGGLDDEVSRSSAAGFRQNGRQGDKGESDER